MGASAIVDNARAALHETLAVRANRYRTSIGTGYGEDYGRAYGGRSSHTVDVVKCRIHTRAELIGDLGDFAGTMETVPKIVFMLEDMPQKGDVYCARENVAYRIETIEENDRTTVTAQCALVPENFRSLFSPPAPE